jgi:hypothetical protein
MSAEVWIAGAAAAIALAALPLNWAAVRIANRSARAAEMQTQLQQQLRLDAVQPFVWVDIRPDQAVGTLFNLVVGNSGPTTASNVHIKVDPPLPAVDELKERAEAAQARLADGIPSLPPGRTLTWILGQGFNLIKDDGPQTYIFTVSADGPYGSLPLSTHVVDLADWRGVIDRPAGNLHELTKVVQDLVMQMRRLAAPSSDAPEWPT